MGKQAASAAKLTFQAARVAQLWRLHYARLVDSDPGDKTGGTLRPQARGPRKSKSLTREEGTLGWERGSRPANLGIRTVRCLRSPALRENPLTDELFAIMHRADSVQQLCSSIDFCNIPVPAHLQRIFYHLQRIVLAQEDNPRFWRNSAYAPGSLNATDSRQTDVQEDQIWLKLFSFLDRLLAIRSLANYIQDGVLGKQRANGSSDHRVVIDDKNLN